MRLPILAALFCLGLAGGATAQHVRPQIATGLEPVRVTLGGRTFVNHGLVGIGRVPAGQLDGFGDTLGSFSGLATDTGAWRRQGAGYAGAITTLPDRGRNDPGIRFFSDYATRLQRFEVAFTPYDGTADLPAAVASQNQLRLRYLGGRMLTDADGGPTTGYNPGNGTGTRFGMAVPIALPGGPGAGRLAIDGEAVAIRADGSVYVADEYRPGLYLFGPDGRLTGIVPVPQALIPQKPAGTDDFNSLDQPARGRRGNQGIEGLSITPDGRFLMALLQSAAMQDSVEQDQETRRYTRLLVYDIAADPLPQAPVGHYVVQLPTFRAKGNGREPNRTAAASEILALDARTILMLARDGAGLGDDDRSPMVFKNVQLVSLAGATNLAGTDRETGYRPAAPGGVLDADITAAAGRDFVNLLNVTQLRRFGMNLNAAAPDGLTLSEKWESLGLLPALDPQRPGDVFLLVGNDNDFMTREGVMQGRRYTADADNDSMILVYRLSLPR